jgi:hypothetical protein
MKLVWSFLEEEDRLEHTTDVELLELGLVRDHAGELGLSQVDDLLHLDKDLLCVGIAWGDTLLHVQLHISDLAVIKDTHIVFLDTLINGGSNGVGLAAKLNSVTEGHLLALLDNLVGLGDLSLEVIEVLENLLEVSRHFDRGC